MIDEETWLFARIANRCQECERCRRDWRLPDSVYCRRCHGYIEWATS